MAKQLTLAELAGSSITNSQSATNASTRKVTTVAQDPKNGAIAMSPSEVASVLTKNGVIKPKEEKVVEPPLVEDAFQSMNRRLEESKDWVTNVMMPIVRANAEEMALENQMNEIGVNEDDEPTVKRNLPSEDDLAKMMDDIDGEPEAEQGSNQHMYEEHADKIYKNMLNSSSNNEDIKESEAKAIEHDEKPVKRSVIAAEDTVANEDSDNADLDALMKDLENEDSMDVVDTEDETAEETRARFKSSMESVKIISDPIDFKKFKIRKSGVDSSFVLNKIKNSRVVKRADWALYHTGRSVTFTECSGPELDTLRKNIASSNSVNAVIASLKFVYDHIEDANKPKFESWCRLIRTEDIESLYFGIYRACYSNTNLVARACPTGDTKELKSNCGKTSLVKSSIDDMVKYGLTDSDDPEKIKKDFINILNRDTTTESNAFESELMQISDDIVISYAPASLYSTFIQYSTLKSEITEKYADILNTMAYIDGFFSIDRTSGELVPIDIKVYPTNINKTVLSKLNVYTGILKSLSNDQYNALVAKLDNIIQAPKIRYVYPDSVCPECGAKIPEEPIDSVLNLLFTRAQLAQIKSL